MQLMKDVMSRNVQVISPDATLKDAAMLMRNKGIGMLPVGENDRMIGTITDRDIAIRAVADGKSVDSTVRDVMTKELVWAYEDDTVAQGASKMSECQIRRLPVVNADKRLVGMVSLGDFAVEVEDMRVSAQALEEISRD
ncbi:CBS domain-containing protein [Hydrogenophaga palleronii]|uniref:CBS domain-containing protein n=1 Tax=Hydrogenophaga palleronii TaxID=65655 RepID=A0ABU1WNW2_9BURK|nr:CBS domain-containing protein [Hydrogenophaga palleronii]MDR7150691.1 CBS domain-containing protein [Hydrogenophaga palleronii]